MNIELSWSRNELCIYIYIIIIVIIITIIIIIINIIIKWSTNACLNRPGKIVLQRKNKNNKVNMSFQKTSHHKSQGVLFSEYQPNSLLFPNSLYRVLSPVLGNTEYPRNSPDVQPNQTMSPLRPFTSYLWASSRMQLPKLSPVLCGQPLQHPDVSPEIGWRDTLKWKPLLLGVKPNHFPACFFFLTQSIDIQRWVDNDVHSPTLGRPTRNFTAAEALLPLGNSWGKGSRSQKMKSSPAKLGIQPTNIAISNKQYRTHGCFWKGGLEMGDIRITQTKDRIWGYATNNMDPNGIWMAYECIYTWCIRCTWFFSRGTMMVGHWIPGQWGRSVKSLHIQMGC